MEKMEKRCGVLKTEKKCDFTDVCDDPIFFEREGNMRHYIICTSCGFIPLSMVDQDTKYLDLHCKCGTPAVYASFSEEEILKIVESRTESERFADLLKNI